MGSVVRESSFNGTLTNSGEVAYTVGVDQGTESHPASMRKVNEQPANITYRVTRVVDGDTFECADEYGKETRVRIFGVDAPEKESAIWRRVQRLASKLHLRRSISLQVKQYDRYRRAIADVRIEQTDVASEMLRSGWLGGIGSMLR